VSLSTDRLLLREFTEDDWRAVHEYAVDPEVVRYVEFGPNTPEETRKFVADAIEHQRDDPRRVFSLAVVLREDGRLIGACGLREGDHEAWIGYCLSRDHWGLGLGTEAAGRMLEFGFEVLGLHRIYATCDPGNIASARVLEKVGMRREGLLRKHKLVKGTWWDSYLYAILDEEWSGHHPPAE
jgi:RimJ/RimL family protein N-acetyltransferase